MVRYGEEMYCFGASIGGASGPFAGFRLWSMVLVEVGMPLWIFDAALRKRWINPSGIYPRSAKENEIYIYQ